MRILPVINNKISNRSAQNVNFEAKKTPKIVNKELRAKLKSITDFFADPKNQQIIKEKQEYSQKVSQFIEENIHVKPEVMNTPFGPIGGKWPHERV